MRDGVRSFLFNWLVPFAVGIIGGTLMNCCH
jgi:hypothetical protein